ncbi:MAG TPA: hypothetical protein VNT76_10570 [Candidatus Binatus sp.]|nr:hypothetical protein [Candidatus Binatus sp.]
MKFILDFRCWSGLLFALIAISGCASSGQTISESSIEERIALLRIGESTKSDVERILGIDHSVDRNRWAYNFSDTVYELAERRQGPGLGILPLSAGVSPTNTRAVVTAQFDGNGVVKQLEIMRYFEDPFINEYWYLVKESEKEPLQSVAKLGESIGMKAALIDADAGTFTLEDVGTKAKIAVKLEGQKLHLTTRNPHHRLSGEYRAFAKREYALTTALTDSEMVQ